MRHYRCNICNHFYPETDLIIDKESKQLICKNCAVSKKKLDDEQKETETAMRREHDGS